MADEPQTSLTAGPGVRDWLRIFGAARMALHPTKLVLALAALMLTYCWGVILDGAWGISGRGVEGTALARFVHPESVPAAEAAAGEFGICQLWGQHAHMSVQRAMHAACTLNFRGPGSLWEAAGGLCDATRWMVSEHLFFAILFFVGTLAIWSLFGPAICRIAAVQFARDEKIGIGSALKFAWEKFVSGFFISPLLPIWIMLGIALLLAIGGFFLWIPGIGNLFALLFPLALAGGFAIVCVLIGCAGGGSFFWPTVAVEGSDGFDAISRSFSYFFGRPVKAILYGLTALVWGGICWVILKYVLWLTLRVTHTCVAFGTGWGGARGAAGEEVTKLDVLWIAPRLSDLYETGGGLLMGGWEIFAAICIGICVLLAIGLLWAFLASFYFSGSTIIYYLLRRDVDATDHEEVYMEEEEEEMEMKGEEQGDDEKPEEPVPASQPEQPAEGAVPPPTVTPPSEAPSPPADASGDESA